MTCKLLSWLVLPYNFLIPYFRISWTIVCLPIIYLGLIITFIGLLVANGSYDAKYWWKNQGINF